MNGAPTSMQDPAAAFSATYAEARARFLAAARARGWPVASHEHPSARGAHREVSHSHREGAQA